MLIMKKGQNKFFFGIIFILLIIVISFLYNIDYSVAATGDEKCKANDPARACIDATLLLTGDCIETPNTSDLCAGPNFEDLKFQCCKNITMPPVITCGTKYPGDGQCKPSADPCPTDFSEDTSADLCEPNNKCCHKYATQINYILQVPLFGYTKATGINDYISNIYKYGLIVLVPIVILIIIIAGMMWILAGGDIPAIKRAKNYISGAIIGLIIAVLSYYILSLIGLTKLNPLQVQYIVAVPPEDLNDEYFVGLESYTANQEAAPANTPVGESIPGLESSCGSVPIYRQGGRSPWGKKSYGGCGTYGSSACGATSFAMVVSSYGVNKDPYAAGEGILVPCGCRPCNGGTDGNCFTSRKPCALNKVGFKGVQIAQGKVIQYVQTGKPIIASVGTCKFTAHRHYIVLACWKDNKFYVHDPNAKHPSPWPSAPQEVFGCAAPRFYYIAPANKFQPI